MDLFLRLDYQSNHYSILNGPVYAFIKIISLKMHVNVGVGEKEV